MHLPKKCLEDMKLPEMFKRQATGQKEVKRHSTCQIVLKYVLLPKLDGVGPVDNRPSTD